MKAQCRLCENIATCDPIYLLLLLLFQVQSGGTTYSQPLNASLSHFTSKSVDILFKEAQRSSYESFIKPMSDY